MADQGPVRREPAEHDLERALTDLAAHLDHPPTPAALTDSVVARLQERPARPTLWPGWRRLGTGPGWRSGVVAGWRRLGPSLLRGWRRFGAGPGWRRRVAVAAVVALVAATVAVVATPGAREAVARRLGLGGVEIRFGGTPATAPTATTTAPGLTTPPAGLSPNLGLGRRVTLEQARAAVAFRLQVPTAPGLARPDAVHLSEDVVGGRVDLVYRPRPGLPPSPSTDAGLLVTQFRGEPLIEKTVGPGTTIERVTVGGEAGYWISGERHGFVYFDITRRPREETARLAGSTLLWTEGGVTLRLEGQLSKDRAIAIAESMR